MASDKYVKVESPGLSFPLLPGLAVSYDGMAVHLYQFEVK